MNVLVIPDKFKGTLPAPAAARAIAAGWHRARPQDRLTLLPMTDGGDGFGQVMSRLLAGKVQTTTTIDAAHRAAKVRWWWTAGTSTAMIESARVIGLAMLPAGKFHPFQLDTFGLGRVFQAAARKRARQCLVGIGGSATNDGGFGLARALGWQFLGRNRKSIVRWIDLEFLQEILPPPTSLDFSDVTVAVDVGNPLLGTSGATHVYGPQKGLRPRDFAKAERCLRQLAKITQKTFRRDLSCVPGAGAAGGLGFGLLTFLGAQLEPGFDLFARHAALDQQLNGCDLVLTGEGAIDRSSLMGKGVGQIADRCVGRKIPCIAFAGTVAKGTENRFTEAHALTEVASLRDAKAKAAACLERLAAAVARRFS